jgi:hypothetical protein
MELGAPFPRDAQHPLDSRWYESDESVEGVYLHSCVVAMFPEQDRKKRVW